MKKRIVLVASGLLVMGITVFSFYIWSVSPFLPHIERNDDGTFTYNNMTYMKYFEPDFMQKFGHLKRGKKLAIINKQNDQPWCTVYAVQGDNSNNVLIVYEEIIMSTDTYYVIE